MAFGILNTQIDFNIWYTVSMKLSCLLAGGIVKKVWACGEYEVDTALGCIPFQMDKFIEWFLPYLFGIAGGISFLLMVYGFILMTMSKGDPKAVQGAKETVTSAITGLLVSIFAIFLLRLVAVGILKIPGI